MARARTPARPIDLAQMLPALRELLERDRVVNATVLGRAQVPPLQRAEAMARLEAEGYERTRTAVRVPLRRQLLATIKERQSVRLPELVRLVRGATQKEIKAAVEALAGEGAVQIVLRGKAEAVAAPSLSTLSREEVAAVSRACRALAELSGRALRKSRATLLREDVREQLLDLVSPRTDAPLAAKAATPALADLAIAELERQLRPIGLCFVPDAVRALQGHGIANAQAALLDAARGGRIELQPDSGLNRLSPQELELCPPGPQGTRLSWARILRAAP